MTDLVERLVESAAKIRSLGSIDSPYGPGIKGPYAIAEEDMIDAAKEIVACRGALWKLVDCDIVVSDMPQLMEAIVAARKALRISDQK